jgi:hypothetical protein
MNRSLGRLCSPLPRKGEDVGEADIRAAQRVGAADIRAAQRSGVEALVVFHTLLPAAYNAPVGGPPR